MFAYPLRTAALTAAAIIGLSGCATPYGYSGVSLGYGSGYYGGYGSGYYGGYGSGYYNGYGYSPYRLGLSTYWGWYDGFYYPGTGYYVYDRYRRPHRWSDRHRRYWTDRQRRYAQTDRSNVQGLRSNWEDFQRDRRPDSGASRVERRGDQPVVRSRTTAREQMRVDRRQDRQVENRERRENRRNSRRQTRESRRD